MQYAALSLSRSVQISVISSFLVVIAHKVEGVLENLFFRWRYSQINSISKDGICVISQEDHIRREKNKDFVEKNDWLDKKRLH